MIIDNNLTALDVSLNLTGSLAGLPAVLSQLPVSTRLGFDDLPNAWDVVTSPGQTWTPDISGLQVDFVLEIYNTSAIAKAPFTTDFVALTTAASWGNSTLKQIL